MKKHSRIEYEQNEREMLALFRKLDWKDQVVLIGRMEVMTERTEPTKPGTIIHFPMDTFCGKKPLST